MLARFRGQPLGPDCQGGKITNPAALHKDRDTALPDLIHLPIDELEG